VSLSDIVTFSFRGQLSLFAHAVLRVLQDLLIGGSFANYLDQNFSTSWLRRCLWLSFSPTVYGNGSDFVSADTLRFCTFVRTIFLQRGPVWSSFSRQGLYPCFSLLLWGFTKFFCWPAYTRTSLSTCLLHMLQLLQFQPFTNFGGGV
jgi:hypothetical protein